VFKDGYIVSASHLDNAMRIGKVLTDLGIITEDALETALKAQAQAGADRRPLIVTLVEMGLAREEDAYRGLEHLIEQTIVDILSWKRGTFTLEAKPATSSDGYRYYPGQISREIGVDTQGALMEALRIYDERMRDGLLVEEAEEATADDTAAGAEPQPLLSADDLGLGDLEQIETRPRRLFTSLDDVNPRQAELAKLRELAPNLPDIARQRLATVLLDKQARPAPSGTLPVLIIFSPDEILSHCLTTFCSQWGVFVCATREIAQLATVSKRSAALNSAPIIIFDAPDTGDGDFAADREGALAQIRKHPEPGTTLLQLASAGDSNLMLQAYTEGFRSVVPRPATRLATDGDAEQLILFLASVRQLLGHCLQERASEPLVRLKASLTRLLEQPSPQGVAAALLQQVADLSERALTLVFNGSELVAEKGIGISAARSAGMLPAPPFRIPVPPDSGLQQLLAEGRTITGEVDEPALRHHLFTAIGAPLQPAGMLLPLRRRGQTLAVIYGDFGAREASAVNGELLEMLAALANLVLDKTSRASG
jgi:hypothetical protein